MSIRTISDFAAAWEYESAATSKVFAGLAGASLAQAVVPGGRTPGFIAWHIAVAIPEIFTAPRGGPASCRQVAAIAATPWAREPPGKRLPPRCRRGSRKKGFVLGALIAQQTHHCGQITVLMRQAGLKVPGIYGPAREEWAAPGMPEQP